MHGAVCYLFVSHDLILPQPKAFAKLKDTAYNVAVIKKTTTAIFRDGAYQGDYDWQRGIPLSETEVIAVELHDGHKLRYEV